MQVEFTPAVAGNQSGVVTVSDILHSQTVALTGTGLTPGVITASPASLTFTNQQVGMASTPQTVTVTNTGGAAIENINFAFTGAAQSSYSLGTVTCGASLAANASCTAQVIFTPSGIGAVTAALNVSSSTLGVQAASVVLSGAGTISSGLTVSPSTVTFGVAGTSQNSTAQTVTITNSTSNTIPSLTLAVAGPFALSVNTCSGSLASGSGCSASIVFSPTISGPASGTLIINSPALSSPITVALTGTGFSFTVSAAGTASQTVSAGQTASYTLALTPNGAPATFSLACGALPEYASCAFQPATETLDSGVPGNVTANISTGGVTSAKLNRATDWHAAPLLIGLLLFPAAIARRRRGWLLVVLLSVLAAGVSACTSSGGGGGGGGGGQKQTTTPAGTYTITVTATANGISQPLTLTLTVD